MQHYKSYCIFIWCGLYQGEAQQNQKPRLKHSGVNYSHTTKASKWFCLNSAFRILFSQKQDRSIINASTDKRVNRSTSYDLYRDWMQTECIIDFETSLSCGVHCLPTFMPAFVLFLSLCGYMVKKTMVLSQPFFKMDHFYVK